MRARDRDYQSQVFDLRVVNDLVNGIDGRVWNVIAAQLLDPMCQVAARESPIELGIQRFIVIDSRLTIGKSTVGSQVRCLESGYESVPKFFEGRQVNRDEALVGRAQNVGLREPRPIARSGRRTQ